MNNAIEKAKELQNYYSKKMVAKLLGSLEATPLYISVIETVLAEYTKCLSALEAEKPAEDAKRCAVIAWRSNEHPGGLDWIDSAALVIQQYAESYHARECAKCGKS